MVHFIPFDKTRIFLNKRVTYIVNYVVELCGTWYQQKQPKVKHHLDKSQELTKKEKGKKSPYSNPR